MATSTVEDYIKRIYVLQERAGPGEELIPLGRISSALGVVPGTATTMVKALADSGLVRYEPRQGVRLTEGGEKLALHVLRRHRLVELFLVEVLSCDWSEVHEEAEVLEHAITDRILERIDAYLGRPGYDPHGDPIPTAAGAISSRTTCPLDQAAPGKRMTVARIEDQDPGFLAYASARGLRPGVSVAVRGIDGPGEAVTLRVDGKRAITIGRAAARKISVE